MTVIDTTSFGAFLKQAYGKDRLQNMIYDTAQTKEWNRLRSEFERRCIPAPWTDIVNSHDHQLETPVRLLHGFTQRTIMYCFDHCPLVLVEVDPGRWYVPGNEQGEVYCQKLRKAYHDQLLEEIML